ncbi:uncharacterized protein LOC130664980 [Microplitis mediator]|uniref:uncharacterized protein LOC130664980 n=1 Tax=Microplitis mediator TaxID=375433 RepID=UPI002556E626|nr:uncharacterized protein LOC130664980 [Microplitis mediator]
MDPMEWFAWNLKKWRDELTKTDLDDMKQVERIYEHVKEQQTVRWELMSQWLRVNAGELPVDTEPWLSADPPPESADVDKDAAAEVINSMSPSSLQRGVNKLSSILSDDEVSDSESLPRDKANGFGSFKSEAKEKVLDSRVQKSYSDLMSGDETAVSESSWSSNRIKLKLKSSGKKKPGKVNESISSIRAKARARAWARARAKAKDSVVNPKKSRRSLSPGKPNPSQIRLRKSPMRILNRVPRTRLVAECYRCHKVGHRYRDCREIWCRRCKMPDVTVRTCPNCRFTGLDNNNWDEKRSRSYSDSRQSPIRNIRSPIRRRVRQ